MSAYIFRDRRLRRLKNSEPRAIRLGSSLVIEHAPAQLKHLAGAWGTMGSAARHHAADQAAT